MPTSRPAARWIALTLALGVLDATASAERPAAPEPATAEVTIPFAHGVGDRWRLTFECEERGAEERAAVVVHEAEAAVLSPLGRDLLVELRWWQQTAAGRTLALWPRREESAAALDARGGGRLLLRVDVRGSALAVTNREEALAALERAEGRALAAAEAEQRIQRLLDEWNVAYGACGVPLVPGATRSTPLGDAGVVGDDERVLLPEGPEPAQPVAWSVRSSTALREAASGEPVVRVSAATRFDLVSRRLSGWQLTVRTDPARRSVRRIAFAEHAAATAPEPSSLAVAR